MSKIPRKICIKAKRLCTRPLLIMRLHLLRRQERTDCGNKRFPPWEFPSRHLGRGSDRGAAAWKGLREAPGSRFLSGDPRWCVGIPTPTLRRKLLVQRDLYPSRHSPQWLLATRRHFPRLWKTREEQRPPARGHGNKAAPPSSPSPTGRGAKQRPGPLLPSSASARGSQAGRAGTPRPAGVAAGGGGGERRPRGLGPPGGGARALPRPPRPPFPAPPPRPFPPAPAVGKGEGGGKESAPLWKGAEGGGEKKKKGTETWPSAVRAAVPRRAPRRAAIRTAGLAWAGRRRELAPRPLPLTACGAPRVRALEAAQAQSGPWRRRLRRRPPERVPRPALPRAPRPRSRRFHAPARGCVLGALKEERAAGESGRRAFRGGTLRRASAGSAPPGREGAGQVAARRADSNGRPTGGRRGGGEWPGWHSWPSFPAVSGGGESPEPAGCVGGEAAPGRASPRRRPGSREPLAWKRWGSGPRDRGLGVGWGRGGGGVGIGGSWGGFGAERAES